MKPAKTTYPTKELCSSLMASSVRNTCHINDDIIISTLDEIPPQVIENAYVCPGFCALLITECCLRMSIGGQYYDVERNTIIFINRNAVMNIKSYDQGTKAYFFSMSREFVEDVMIDASTLTPLILRFGSSPLLKVEEADCHEIVELFKVVRMMIRSKRPTYKGVIVKTLLSVGIYIINDICTREKVRNIKVGRIDILFEQFIGLLEENFVKERRISFYAEKLNISSKYLSLITNTISDKSPAMWIDYMVLSKAKCLLRYSTKSIQQICYELHFANQSFFAKYFKKHTGVTPLKYRSDRANGSNSESAPVELQGNCGGDQKSQTPI